MPTAIEIYAGGKLLDHPAEIVNAHADQWAQWWAPAAQASARAAEVQAALRQLKAIAKLSPQLPKPTATEIREISHGMKAEQAEEQTMSAPPSSRAYHSKRWKQWQNNSPNGSRAW